MVDDETYIALEIDPTTPHRTVIGRAADGVDVNLPDAYVSTRHAAIIVEDLGQVFVADLGSTNGTTVDGHKIYADRYRLLGDAILRVGHTNILLSIR